MRTEIKPVSWICSVAGGGAAKAEDRDVGEYARGKKLQRKPETESGNSHAHQVTVVFL